MKNLKKLIDWRRKKYIEVIKNSILNLEISSPKIHKLEYKKKTQNTKPFFIQNLFMEKKFS